MIIKDINQLRQKCEPVESLEEAKELISKLEFELDSSNKLHKNGIGLAASQIGIYKKAAIIRVNKKIKLDIVNCNIEAGFDLGTYAEGCLSLPGQNCVVQRNQQILIKNNDFGNIKEFFAYGLPAICIQHEMDHWDGVLMFDKAIVEHNSIGPNQPCPCGSGLKYKRCCKR